MPGLSPEDPRFEKAVAYGCRLFARNPLVNSADLDDLAQEIRIALLDHGSAAPGLCARYTALDWWRDVYGRRQDGEWVSSKTRGAKRMELMDRPVDSGKRGARTPLALAQSTALSPDHVLLSREIDAVLERLPKRDRFILTARYFRQMTMREIGDAIGISECRVCQLLPQAEKKFRALATQPPVKRAA